MNTLLFFSLLTSLLLSFGERDKGNIIIFEFIGECDQPANSFAVSTSDSRHDDNYLTLAKINRSEFIQSVTDSLSYRKFKSIVAKYSNIKPDSNCHLDFFAYRIAVFENHNLLIEYSIKSEKFVRYFIDRFMNEIYEAENDSNLINNFDKAIYLYVFGHFIFNK